MTRHILILLASLPAIGCVEPRTSLSDLAALSGTSFKVTHEAGVVRDLARRVEVTFDELRVAISTNTHEPCLILDKDVAFRVGQTRATTVFAGGSSSFDSKCDYPGFRLDVAALAREPMTTITLSDSTDQIVVTADVLTVDVSLVQHGVLHRGDSIDVDWMSLSDSPVDVDLVSIDGRFVSDIAVTETASHRFTGTLPSDAELGPAAIDIITPEVAKTVASCPAAWDCFAEEQVELLVPVQLVR